MQIKMLPRFQNYTSFEFNENRKQILPLPGREEAIAYEQKGNA